MGTLITEMILIAVVGILSMIEGIRLVMAAKLQLYDVLGPGFYNMGMGFILMIVGVIYFIFQSKEVSKEKKES